MARRRLTAVDDPLVFGEARPPSTQRAAQTPTAPTAALYVRLPLAESDRLARAAFELGVFKRDLIAALIARHVDPHSDDGLATLRTTVEAYRQQAT
jgi:hypothetical protein